MLIFIEYQNTHHARHASFTCGLPDLEEAGMLDLSSLIISSRMSMLGGRSSATDGV